MKFNFWKKITALRQVENTVFIKINLSVISIKTHEVCCHFIGEKLNRLALFYHERLHYFANRLV